MGRSQVVDERKMAVVRRIFRMVSEEGLAITPVAKILRPGRR
jgi:hypothetical protein